MFFVSHLYFGRVKRPSSGWMAVTSITHHYYMITNKFENLHALQRKINTRALLPDARPSRPILAVKKVSYIQALRLNTVQPVGPLAFFIPESWLSTTTKFRLRFNNHKARFRAHSRLSFEGRNKDDLLYRHFFGPGHHGLEDVSIQLIDRVSGEESALRDKEG